MLKIKIHYIYERLILIGFFLLLSINIVAQEKISLDEGWKFHFGNAAHPDKDFDYSSVSLLHKSNVFATTVINPKFEDTSCKCTS